MTTTLNEQGQIIIPKQIRDSVEMTPGTKVEFQVNSLARVELDKEGEPITEKDRRFRSAIGSATVKWDTDELMALLRGDD